MRADLSSFSSGRAARRLAASILGVLSVSACAIATPFDGPGFDRGSGTVTAPGEGPLVLAVTEAVLRRDADARDLFMTETGKVAEALETAPGYVGGSLRTELFGDRRWTMTVWTDMGAMAVFNYDPVHQAAISRAMGSLAGGRVASVAIPRADAPVSWDAALAVLEEAGRPIGPRPAQAARPGG